MSSRNIYPKIPRLHERHENSFLLQEKIDGSNFLVVFDYKTFEFVDCYTKTTLINEKSDKLFVEAKENIKKNWEQWKNMILGLKVVNEKDKDFNFNAFCCEILGMSKFPYNKIEKGKIFIFDIGWFNKKEMKVTPYLMNLNDVLILPSEANFRPVLSVEVDSLENIINVINDFVFKDSIEGWVIKDKLLKIQYKYIYKTEDKRNKKMYDTIVSKAGNENVK